MERIKKFLPERIMQTERPDFENFDERHATKYFFYALQIMTRFVHTRRYDEASTKQFFDPIMSPLFAQLLCIQLPDQGQWLTAAILAKYWWSPTRAVHVFEQQFFEKFSRVKLDGLQFGHLPKDFVGFVRIPTPVTDRDGEKFQDLFLFAGEKQEVVFDSIAACQALARYFGKNIEITPAQHQIKMSSLGFYAAYLTNNANDDASLGYCHAPMPEDSSSSIAEYFKNSKETRFDILNAGTSTTTIADGYRGETPLMFNTLMYLASGDPDLREFRNEIRHRSPTSSTPIRADADLSQEKIVLVGYNYMKEKLYSPNLWYSSSHLGWRWCGPNRSVPRLVFVKGSIKRWSQAGVECEEGEE